jgi:SAM-dependent methyltransferase
MLSVYRKLAGLGTGAAICCVLNRIKLHLLRLYFGFDRWHADAPCCCRPYKQSVVSHLLAHSVKGVVEIGCGLGDIGYLLRGSSVQYAGLDLERAVVEAGRFIRPDISLQVGSFDDLPTLGKQFDTLLLLNWPHGMNSEQLVALLSSIPNWFSYIAIDFIRPEAPDLGFKFRHCIDDFLRLGLKVRLLTKIENLDNVRDLVILKNGR